MILFDGFAFFVALGFWVYCLFDVITTPPEQVRNLPKIGWLLIVVLLDVIGAGLWLVAGRPRRRAVAPRLPQRRQGPPRGSTGPLAPDDDPDFLRSLGHPDPPEGHTPA